MTNSTGIFDGEVGITLSNNYLGKGHWLLASATDTQGSTSEFSNCIKVQGLYYRLFLPSILK